jgi:hypothetical protein
LAATLGRENHRSSLGAVIVFGNDADRIRAARDAGEE